MIAARRFEQSTANWQRVEVLVRKGRGGRGEIIGVLPLRQAQGQDDSRASQWMRARQSPGTAVANGGAAMRCPFVLDWQWSGEDVRAQESIVGTDGGRDDENRNWIDGGGIAGCGCGLG